VLDLDEMTWTAFEPVPSNPQVIPVNGKLQIRCRRPAGLPVPSVRWLGLGLPCCWVIYCNPSF